MLKNMLNHAAVRDRLTGWLPGALGGAEVSVTGVTVPQSSGMSCDTVLIDAVVDGEARGFVARIAPTAHGIFPVYDLEREARIMDALSTGTALPVPALIGYEPDPAVLGAPFLVVERHHGRVPADDPPFSMSGWVMECSDAQRSVMFDGMLRCLATLGNASVDALGLTGLGRPGSGSVTENEVAHWADYYEFAAGAYSYPTIEATLEWLTDNCPSDSGQISLSWGDCRFGNVMFGDDCQVTGMLDWEMARTGPRELDLGFFLFTNRMFTAGLGVPLPGGFLDREQTIARYEELSGNAANDIEFYEILAGYLGAATTMCVARRLVEMGVMPPDATMPTTTPASLTLATLLDVPAPVGEAGWISGR